MSWRWTAPTSVCCCISRRVPSDAANIHSRRPSSPEAEGLCRTSNPGASDLQHLDAGGKPIYRHVVALAERLNARENIGLVVGATAPAQVAEIRRVTDLPFLVPGVGAQGGDVEASVRAAWNGDPASCLVAASRSVIFAESPARAAAALRTQINAAAGARA